MNVPAVLGASLIEQTVLSIILWLLLGFSLFLRLIPVYLIKFILHISNRTELYHSLVRNICIENGLASSHLVFPLTFESVFYWSKFHFYIELIIGISVISTTSIFAGEKIKIEVERENAHMHAQPERK